MSLCHHSDFSLRLIRQAWMSETKSTDAPNVLNMILRFNNGSRWIQSEILTEENIETRAAIVRFILRLLRHLLVLNNFNAAMQISSAFNGSALFRLKKTMEQISEYENNGNGSLTRSSSISLSFRYLVIYLHPSNLFALFQFLYL